jgi:hypothetical protein
MATRKKTQATPPKVDVGQIEWSLRRIPAAASVLDDIDGGQLFYSTEKAERLREEVVREALSAFLKQHAAAVLSEVTANERA